MKALQFSVAVFMSLFLAATVAHAMCGVMKQFFAVSRGLSGAGGSVERTSTAAAAICPELSALARSHSLTTGPREVFIRIADFFIRARRSLLTRF